jgi:hypothetical protein
MAFEIWNDNLDFDDFDDFTEEDWEILFEEAEPFEIKTTEYKKHCVEIHTYSKLGELQYPYEFDTDTETDIHLN